jgi:filamentous hemagglutinin family protein
LFKTGRLIILLVINSQLHAEVITDGTLGTQLNLLGPDFQIEANLGQQIGGNLFHSFQNFNLQSHESAIFSGPNSVNIIFSRVTGGNASQINGTIRSTIPYAELFLLNPAGIILGESARLDVQGGFHASTADYMRLGTTGRFDARVPPQSILTTAPPTAFGFLDAPNPIQVQGSELTIAPQADFSLIGGDLTLNHAQLNAASGRFNLVSVASSGEVIAKADRLDRIPETTSFTKLGRIEMTASHLETSGLAAGGISIRGGKVWLRDSLIHAHTLGDSDGKDIDILTTDWLRIRGGPTNISSTNIDNQKPFGIVSNTFGKGKAGHIAITTPRLEMRQSIIDTSTKNEGDAGNIDIYSQQIRLEEGAEIVSNTYGTGAGGQINLKATEQLALFDQRIFLTAAKIANFTHIKTNTFNNGNGGHIMIETGHLSLFAGYILSNTDGQGNSGTIIIHADRIEVFNGGGITASALRQASGHGGNIKVNVTDTIKLSGFRPGFVRDGSVTIHNFQSTIAPATLGKGLGGSLEISTKNLIVSDYATIGAATMGIGAAGNMTIVVDNLYLKDGGILTNSSGGIVGGELWLATGEGGHITVIAKENMVISGHNPFNPSSITSNSLLSGQGGNLNIQANHLILADGGTISANTLGIGNAGNIHIQANQLSLTNGGKITAAAAQAVGGGITVSATDLLYLRKAQLTTSVHGGKGNGGNITIENPALVVLGQSQIVAQADQGQGGNIRLVADTFFKTPDSLISASSRLGIDGEIVINSPDESVGNNLLALPTGFIDISGLLPRPCEAMTLQEYLKQSSFRVNRLAGNSLLSPFDFKPSPPLVSTLNLSTPAHNKISHFIDSNEN